MGTLAPMDDRQCIPVQVADLIANTTTEMFAKVKNPESDLGALHEWLPKLQWVAYADKEYLGKLVHQNLHNLPQA